MKNELVCAPIPYAVHIFRRVRQKHSRNHFNRLLCKGETDSLWQKVFRLRRNLKHVLNVFDLRAESFRSCMAYTPTVRLAGATVNEVKSAEKCRKLFDFDVCVVRDLRIFDKMFPSCPPQSARFLRIKPLFSVWNKSISCFAWGPMEW